MSSKQQTPSSVLRNIATLQTLSHGAQPRERHHLVSRFARLENERARLEHEAEMWGTRKKATDDKLAKVCEQIDALREVLLEEPAKGPMARQARGRNRPRPSTEIASAATPPRHCISLEY